MKQSDKDFFLDTDGGFVIRQFDEKKSFSNFLPGIAGLLGTPLWAFYVNRGQALASFGTRNKDGAILEFFPANKAYQMVSHQGFRTFIKIKRGKKAGLYEPFAPLPGKERRRVTREMVIRPQEFEIRERNPAVGLAVTVRYFTVPGESLGVLSREVTVAGLSRRGFQVEILDGLPQVLPYGMTEAFVKTMSRTIEAWMLVENVASGQAPFFRLRVDATDRPEVLRIKEGNFFFSQSVRAGRAPRILQPIVDPAVLFGQGRDFKQPALFSEAKKFRVPKTQVCQNQTPCAFSFVSDVLSPEKPVVLRSYFGHAPDRRALNRYAAKTARSGYYESKREENRKIIDGIQSRAFTVSSSNRYDLYCGQTYLDNVLRGGLPVSLGSRGRSLPFYVYSRKHGDLERDYNRFVIEPDYFSQGNGNYRDVNQNRRNDVWFDPEVKDANIRTFFNLIQWDGFNPLIVKGNRLVLKKSKRARNVLARSLKQKNVPAVETFLRKPFSPGEFCRFLEEKNLLPRSRFLRFLGALSPHLALTQDAEHGEGFWTDHWTYNLDLIENYLSIYPEKKQALLFDTEDFSFFDAAYIVEPRSRKTFLTKRGTIRQYGAVAKDKEKARLLASRSTGRHLARTKLGRGKVYRSVLFIKLLSLLANKLASLDPQGSGIEMEADKPSWYDALNGLPGLFGSSLPETFELKRLALFMVHAIEDLPDVSRRRLALPVELYQFTVDLERELKKRLTDRPSAASSLAFWKALQRLKEKFRAATRWGISGRRKSVSLVWLKTFIEHALEKLDIGLDAAYEPSAGLYPTYFENEVTRYRTARKTQLPSSKGKLSLVKAYAEPLHFRRKPLPYFLEGLVHALKVETNFRRRRALLKAVRRSALYDRKLKMYKVNAPLAGTSLEIGRACVFTPGWLENESIWLHMEFKFLLELLKSGLKKEFFEDVRNVLMPFQPAARYGRNILENSSFIVSSAFPDPKLHGTGFVARLSGATAEFLSMWNVMNAGPRPFMLGVDGKLSLRLAPSLPGSFFTKNPAQRTYTDLAGNESRVTVPKNCFAFLFLGRTLVYYHNPKRRDTYGPGGARIRRVAFQSGKGKRLVFEGDTVPSPYALDVREGRVSRLDVYLG